MLAPFIFNKDVRMKKLLGLMLLSLALVGCNDPDIKGKYTASKQSFFMSLTFTLELMDEGKGILHLPEMGPIKASSNDLNYTFEDGTLSIWEKGKEDQIVMKVEEKGKILRLVSNLKGFPEVWTKKISIEGES